MQLGHNDSCPCGSEKKYKKCCLSSESSTQVIDLNWHKLRKTEGELIEDHLLPYIDKTFPKDLIPEAWDDFTLGMSLPEEAMKGVFSELFMPWFLFNWIPIEEISARGTILKEEPIALHYLKCQPNRLSSYQQQFIKAISQTYYSFYVVLEVIPDKNLLLKDIILGIESRVKERSETQYLTKGNIIFTRVLTLDNQSICVGVSPYVIDGRYHSQLLDFRDELIQSYKVTLTSTNLREEFEWEVRQEWLSLLEEILNPSLPQLHNTDGEIIEFCKVYFTSVLSPEAAFRKLLPLTLSQDASPFLDEAERNKQGEIIKIELPWLKRGNKKKKGWSNTVLGTITIHNDRLIAEVNSRTRAQKIQALLKKYLAESIIYKKTLHESAAQKLKAASSLKSIQQKSLKDKRILQSCQLILNRWLRSIGENGLIIPYLC